MSGQSPHPKIVEVLCQGSPYEMGLAQGSGVQNKIHAAEEVLVKLEAFRLQQPWWLPFSVYKWLSGKKAIKILSDPLRRDYPHMIQRLAGIAEGAGEALGQIYLFNALEPLLSAVGGSTACPGACSAVAVRGKRSLTGEPIIAQNFDYLPLIQPYYLVRETRPTGKFRAFEFTTVPTGGAVDGMNEKGLSITYNYGFATDKPAVPSAPISMAISEALEHCATVTEAASFLESKPRWGAGLLMLADENGDIASLELSSTRSFLRRPNPGEDHLFHTNDFSEKKMSEIQISRDAIYTEKAPAPLRGRRVHLSSETRNQRFKELLATSGAIGTEGLGKLMADHGPTGNPHDFTPCVHGSYWQTTACLQFLPMSRRIRVAYESACKAKYQEIGF